MSNDVANNRGSVVVVAPITSQTKNRRFPQNVYLGANDPLPMEGLVLCGQIRTVSKEIRLDGYRADLSVNQLREVERALAVILALPKPPLLN